MSYAKWQPFCLCLYVLIRTIDVAFPSKNTPIHEVLLSRIHYYIIKIEITIFETKVIKNTIVVIFCLVGQKAI